MAAPVNYNALAGTVAAASQLNYVKRPYHVVVSVLPGLCPQHAAPKNCRDLNDARAATISKCNVTFRPCLRCFAMQWMTQLHALMVKCLTVISYRFTSTLSIALLPSVFVGGLWLLWSQLTVSTAPPERLAVQTCVAYNVYGAPYSPSDPCVTLLFAPDNDPTAVNIMQRVAASTGLSFGSDIKGMVSDAAAAGYLFDHPYQQVDSAVIFNISDPIAMAAGQVYYSLWYNHSLTQNYARTGGDDLWVGTGASGRLSALQMQVDAAIVAELSSQAIERANGNHDIKPFVAPSTSDTDGGNNNLRNEPGSSSRRPVSALFDVTVGAFSDYESANSLTGGGPGLIMLLVSGATFVICGAIISSLLIMSTITGERSRKLVGQLRTIGLLDSTYWLSWIISFFPVIFLGALVLPGVGSASGVVLFSRTDYSVHLVATFLLGTATMANAMCCGSFVSQRMRVNIASFCVFAVAVAVSITFAVLQLYSFIYIPTIPAVVQVLVGVIPAFHYGKLINSILMYILSAGTASGASGVSAAAASGPAAIAAAARSSIGLGRLGKLLPLHAAFLSRLGLGIDIEWVEGLHARAIGLPLGYRVDYSGAATSESSASTRSVDQFSGSFARSPSAGLSEHVSTATAGWTVVQPAQGSGDEFPYIITVPSDTAASSNNVNNNHRLGEPSAGGSAGTYGQFTWDQLTVAPDPIQVSVQGLPVEWTDFTPAFNLYMLMALTAGYTVLAWYLGQVMTGDAGAAQPFYFPFSPYYWNLVKPPQTAEVGDTIASLQAASAREGSVRIHKLSKNYGKSGGGTQALKEVSLSMYPGQLLALLGQNGAGKTTLVNVISGLAEPTHGEAFMFGKSVRSEMGSLRSVMGTCPQDDLLWEELSARAHVELFARFRGVPEDELQHHVDSRLSTVSLLDVSKAAVDTFSGGMKRRLSVAMSAVGNPQIIFLDEPTTGLDPLSRRKVWSMIETLKPGRVLVLTTHNMEEADALGDQVAILATGRLRAVGTPLFLKARFGAGYQINLLTDPARVHELRALVQVHLPGAEVVGDTSASPTEDGMAAEMAMSAMVYLTQSSASGSSSSTKTPLIPGQPNEGDVLTKRATSGALTIAVPRAQTAAIPAFLRLLQAYSRDADAGSVPAPAGSSSSSASAPESESLVKEWGISNSTLQEVFLRLAAANREVNAPLSISGAGVEAPVMQMPMPAPQPFTRPAPSAGAAPPKAASRVGGGAPGRVCALCECALVEPVVLFTSAKVSVLAPDLLCGQCATRSIESIQETRAAGVAKGMLPADAPALPLAATAASAEQYAAGKASGVSTPGPAGAAGAAPSKMSFVPTTAGPLAAPVAAYAPPAEALHTLDIGTTTTYSSASYMSSGAGRTGPSAGGGVGAGAGLPPRKYPTSDTSRPSRSVVSTKAKRPGEPGYLPPVPFADQFFAVLYLRSVLNCTRGAILMQLVSLAGIGFLVLTGVNRDPVTLTQCSTGFWAKNESTGLCDRGTFVSWLTGAVDRTNFSPVSQPSESESTAASSGRRAASSSSSSSGTSSSGTEHSVDVGAYTMSPFAQLSFNQICTDIDSTAGYCRSPGPNYYPILPDFTQLDAILTNNFYGGSSGSAWPGLAFHYSDAPGAGTGPGSDWRLSDMNVFGLDPSDGALNTNTSIFGQVQLLSAAQMYGAASIGDIDAHTYAAQQTISYNSAPMNSTCSYMGTWAGPQLGFVGWQWFNDNLGAAQWMDSNLPSLGVGIRRNKPDDIANPTLQYDLRMWALLSYSDNDYRPNRANAYTWTDLFLDWYPYGSEEGCWQGYLNSGYATDSPWYQKSNAAPGPSDFKRKQSPRTLFDAGMVAGSKVGDFTVQPQGMPVQAAMSMLHNAFYRSVLSSVSSVAANKNAGATKDATAATSGTSDNTKRTQAPEQSASSVGDTSQPFIRTSILLMPDITWISAISNAGQGDVSFSALLWPMFTMSHLPGIAYFICFEKQSKLLAAMTMAGMRQGPYLMGSYAFTFVLTLISGALYYGLGYVANIPAIINASWRLFAALFLVWAHAQAALGLLLGAALQTPRAATVIATMLIVATSLANFLVNQFVTPWPSSLTWVPLMSYSRAATLILTNGGGDAPIGSELSNALAITFLHGCLALALGFYLHAVIPGPESTGVTKSPLYPLLALPCCSGRTRMHVSRDSGYAGRSASSSSSRSNDDGVLSLTGDAAAPMLHGDHRVLPPSEPVDPDSVELPEDVDVVTERERVLDVESSSSSQSSAAICVHGLVKEYPARIRKSKRTTAAGGYSAVRTTADGMMIVPQPNSLPPREPTLLQRVHAAAVDLTNDLASRLLAKLGLHAACGFEAAVETAVNGLYLRVDHGEVLGLLGPNGAGKTTTIACLTGHSSISGGSAIVAGHDVDTQLSSVWRTLGVCPQFDTVWDDVTVSQHLTFYARVKGCAYGPNSNPASDGSDSHQQQQRGGSTWGWIASLFGSSSRLRAIVQQSAERVELDGDPFRQPAKSLSGGMRRRLSIGISLLGNPSIVCLDEPTTGLDPETKRAVHRIIGAQAGPGRAMIITTHSMEEADALCSRIAIMAKGKLRAVGTQLHLKRRFGDGYRLSMTVSAPHPVPAAPGSVPVLCADGKELLLDPVAALAHAMMVGNVHPEARLIQSRRLGQVASAATSDFAVASTGSRSMSYLLPRTGVDVADVFTRLESLKQSQVAQMHQASVSIAQASIDVGYPIVAGSQQSLAMGLSQPPLVMIAEYGLTQATLEDVFVRVVESAGGGN